MATSYYDYSQLRANGVTPSAVYAKGSPVYRLLANGVDIIHKRTGYTMNFRCGYRFNLSIRKEAVNRWVESWNCGTDNGWWEFDHWRIIAELTPVKDIWESNGDGYILNVGWIHENSIALAVYDRYGNSYNSWGYYGNGGRSISWDIGYYDTFDHVTVSVNKDFANVRWSLDGSEVQYNLNTAGNFTSGGTFELWGGWVSRSKTVQEY